MQLARRELRHQTEHDEPRPGTSGDVGVAR